MWPISSVVDEEKQYFHEIADWCRRENKKNIGVWGSGVRGALMGYSLEGVGFTDFFYIDSDASKQGGILNGKKIFPPDILLTAPNCFVIISVENNSEIIEYLQQINFQKGMGYIAAEPTEDYVYLEKLKSVKENEPLVLGGSLLRNVELKDRKCCLAKMIENSYNVKVLAMNVMPTSVIYFTEKYLCSRGECPDKVTIFLNYEMFTDYNHLLPRTQKLNFVRQLLDWDYDREELESYYETAQKRARDYAIEKQYSPYRGGDEIDKIQKGSKSYAVRMLNNGFSVGNESFFYFGKLVELMKTNNIQGNFVWEPVNYWQYEKLLGEKYLRISEELLHKVDEIVGTGIKVFKWNHMLEEKQFIAFHSMNDAVRADGRDMIVKELYQVFGNQTEDM